MKLPQAPLAQVLNRVDHTWHADAAPHHVILGQTGAGKSTLIKALLGLCPNSRVLILDVKPNADPVWNGTADDPHRWGRAIDRVEPRFCFEGEHGGGPSGMWLRLLGSPDRADTARRFGAALDIVRAEGSCVLVCEDVRVLCRQLKLAEQVDEILNIGRSANVLCVLSATDLTYVAGRSQGSQVWCGFTGGSLPAAKAAADLLGWRGRERQDYCAQLKRHQWVFSESEEGSAGPVLVTPAAGRI